MKILSNKNDFKPNNIIDNNINFDNDIIYNNNSNKKNYHNIITNIISNNNYGRIQNNRNINNINRKKIHSIKNIMKYTDEEINTLTYDFAILYDKRTYCQYYLSLLKTKSSLIFALFNGNDYNSRIIKIDLFFIGFTIEYVVNALFFNDNTMHKIYKNKGKFDLDNQIPIIIYSTIISSIFETFFSSLALSDDAIISFKQNKSKINLWSRKKYLMNKLKIKFILYFIIGFSLLLFFWYYISMFGVVYKNTQIHLLKDTLISFGISVLYPFGIYLFPGIFRIPALSNIEHKRKYLYNFSKVVHYC